ncbi:venom protease [Osmia lignaria lignaria]|uniref:venom protease n=1 Tax=Osmia lignaria lignaria TaxID=1437193 RepID=UPI0014783D57|nr:proclotting enzyme-like [Osmia lignaria]
MERLQTPLRTCLIRGTFFLCFLCIPWRGQSLFLGDRNVTNSTRNQPVRREQESFHSASIDKALSSTSTRCIGPSEKTGRCEYLTTCFLQEYRSNFSLAMKHACTIDEAYVGVCCEVSKNLVVEEDLANILPLIAVNVEKSKETGIDADASRIVWVAESTTFRTEKKPERPRGCGTSSNGRTRLVGGEPADPREWPWMVALLRKDQTQFCGGVLVTDRHVLTAAHCVNRYERKDVRVRLGEYDFDTSEETRALDFAVSETRVHQDFDPVSYENDIAIVKMHRPTVFDSYVWPVCLPPIDQTFENKSAIVTGWGTSYYGGPASTVLMEVEVPVWPQASCVQSFVQRIPRTVMCAGAYEGGRDACQGDSGGPLLHRLENGKWVNIGIVSWGIRCGEPGRPGIYTRVSSYLDWIFENAVF